MRRVLVTRPEPGASQTARRLEALGFAAVLLPLSATHALYVDRASIPDGVGAVAVTSANAIRHAPRELVRYARANAMLCRRRKDRRSRRGPQAFDASSKVRATPEALARGDRRGQPGRAGVAISAGACADRTFEKMVADAGIAVKAVEVYDTLASKARDRLRDVHPWRLAGRRRIALFRRGGGSAAGTSGTAAARLSV